MSEDLDSPERYSEIRALIQRKAGLNALYLRFYVRFANALKDCPKEGLTLELGSGAGFLKDVLPEVTTSDVLPYSGVDAIVDATRLPYEKDSLRAVLMLNVFHHISDVDRFFEEATRCLKPGGKVIIIDQYPGWIAKSILKFFHHEVFDEKRQEWSFPSEGPLSGANGALAWIVFFRDRLAFENKFPKLVITVRQTHTPLRYWLAGGLKNWTLIPKWGFRIATFLDRFLMLISPEFGSFVHVELRKT